MECLDVSIVAGWFDGDVSAEDTRRVHEHIDRCADCRALFAELGRSLAEAPHFRSDTPAPRGPIAVGDSISRFVVIEWLGAGGMGVVYGAFDPELERRVAVKVIHPDDPAIAEDVGRSLLREAKALARVSHPNVIAVYDVGAHDGHVFIAMEYVHGQTLAAWLRERPRSARDILARFVDAARGLSAAHARGIVHRDFKPSNVLIGSDGRVRVTDFGLAQTAEERVAPSTTARSWAGTPEYMSPEQRRREAVDARSDQYGFAVALHEALSGAKPTSADDKVQAGLSAKVRAAVARGLAENPSERFASMDAFAAALSTDSHGRWRRVFVAAVAIACVLGGGLAYSRARATPGDVCGGAERKLVGVWDGARRQGVRASFRATGASYADDAFDRVARALDDYATRWTRAHRDACEATRVHGEQSDEAMDLRIACLDTQRAELSALTDLFAAADRKVVEGAVQAASATLARIDACGDLTALRSRRRASPDLHDSPEVGALRESLARAHALDEAGRSAESEAVAATVRERALAIGWPSLEAEADYLIGKGKGKRGDFEEADAALYDAASAAELAGDDLDKARALVQLSFNLGEKLAHYDEAEHVGQLARAVLTRLPAEAELLAGLEDDLAIIECHRGRYPEAVARSERALAIRTTAFGPDHVYVAMSYSNFAKALFEKGDATRALAYQERALATWQKTVGPRHPSVALGLFNLAIYERQFRRLAEGEAHAREAIEIWREAFGDAHPNLIEGEGVLATILKEENRLGEAVTYAERSLALVEKILEADHPDHVHALNTVGQIRALLGRPREAIALHLQALAICVRLHDPPRLTSETLAELGIAYLGVADARAAVAPLERSLALRSARSTDPIDLAKSRLLLARALWDGGGDRRRARALAKDSRDTFAASARHHEERDDAERWLAGR